MEGNYAKITEFQSYSGDTIERREVGNSVYYRRIKRARPDPEPVTPPEKDRPGLGILCTAARTEFIEKFKDILVLEMNGEKDEMLKFINYVAKNAYDLGRGSK